MSKLPLPRVGLAMAIAIVSLTLLSASVSAHVPAPVANKYTVPLQIWSIDQDATDDTPLNGAGGWALGNDEQPIYSVLGRQIVAIDARNGSQLWQRELVGSTPDVVCYTPLVVNLVDPKVGELVPRIIVACSPNIVMAIDQNNGGETVWMQTLAADGNINAPPLFQCSKLGSSVQLVLVTLSNGAMIGLDALTGDEAIQPFSPTQPDIFGPDVPITELRAMGFISYSTNVTFLAVEAAEDETSGVKPSAIARYEIPSDMTTPWKFLNRLILTDSKNYPKAHAQFDLQDMTTSGLDLFVRLHREAFAPNPDTYAVWRWSSDKAEAPDAQWETTDQHLLAYPIIESADTKYIISSRASHDDANEPNVAVYNAKNGELVRKWSLPPTSSNPVANSLLSLSEDNQLFFVTNGLVAAAPFNVSSDELEFDWAFNYANVIPTPGSKAREVRPLLNDQNLKVDDVVMQTIDYEDDGSLIVRSSYIDGNGHEHRRLTRIVSTNTDGVMSCGGLPHADTCDGCDSLTGSVTARRCGYCVASDTCMEYRLLGVGTSTFSFLNNATCADSPFTADANDACGSGGSPSKAAAIGVGVTLGLLCIVAIVICYKGRKPKPTVRQTTSYQSMPA